MAATQTTAIQLLKLPVDLLEEIINQCEAKDMARLKKCCKDLHKMIKQEAIKNRARQEFGAKRPAARRRGPLAIARTTIKVYGVQRPLSPIF